MSIETSEQVATYVIWWLSQHDFERVCDLIGPSIPPRLQLPGYVFQMLNELTDNRKWEHLVFSSEVCDDIPEIPSPNYLNSIFGGASGLIILRSDAQRVMPLPGFVTDLTLAPLGYALTTPPGKPAEMYIPTYTFQETQVFLWRHPGGEPALANPPAPPPTIWLELDGLNEEASAPRAD